MYSYLALLWNRKNPLFFKGITYEIARNKVNTVRFSVELFFASPNTPDIKSEFWDSGPLGLLEAYHMCYIGILLQGQETKK